MQFLNKINRGIKAKLLLGDHFLTALSPETQVTWSVLQMISVIALPFNGMGVIKLGGRSWEQGRGG